VHTAQAHVESAATTLGSGAAAAAAAAASAPSLSVKYEASDDGWFLREPTMYLAASSSITASAPLS
jgi:hypothetical protein